jgi:sodium/proline symporter
MSVIALVFVIYLFILAALALWSRREAQTMAGYFIAGKKLPPWVVAFSTNATGESGWLLLGLTGMGYSVGVHAYWVVAGEVTGIAVAWLLMSRRIKRMSDEYGSITVPDVLASRFNDKNHVLRKISTLIILSMVGTYIAAQMVATGKAFSGFTELSYGAGVVFGAAIIIVYTLVGGYKAVAWTDLIQGILMLGGLIIVPIVAVTAAGGWDAVLTTLAAQDPDLLSPWGPDGVSVRAFIAVASFLAIGVGFVGVPQLMVRFMSARSEQSLVPAMVISIIVLLLFDLGAVTTGLAGRALFPGLEDPEGILPLLATELFSPVFAGVLMVVVLAAIMSTADSLLIMASSAVVRDYLQKIRSSTKTDAQLARYGKIVTLVIGVLGVIFALNESPLIFWFVIFAWNGLGAAFGPPLVCALWYPKTTLKGAIIGMVGGFGTTVFWVLFMKPYTYDLLEIIPGFLVGMVLIIVFSKPGETSNPESSRIKDTSGL